MNFRLLTSNQIRTLVLTGVCLLFQSPITYAMLSATTANTIKGNPPYLTFDNGVTKIRSSDELVGIQIGNHFYKKTDAVSTATTPIILPTSFTTLENIKSLIPSGELSLNLADLINSSGIVRDDDGDANLTLTGTLTMTIVDKFGNTVNLTDTLLKANAPYKITMSSTAGSIQTQYGDPKTTLLNATSASYFVLPNISPYATYAQPNMEQKHGARPEWNNVYGFKVQSPTTPGGAVIPEKNFPRTGFNKAYFNLTVVDTTADEVIAESADSSNKVISNNGGEIFLQLSKVSDNVVKVELNGPSYHTPIGDTAVNLPKTFELKARRTDGELITLYGFTLSKWFISNDNTANNRGHIYPYTKAEEYCRDLAGGYRIPSVTELTNANNNNYQWNWGLAGNGNQYVRSIGHGKKNPQIPDEDGGLFAEWGYVSKNGGQYQGQYYPRYPGSDFIDNDYWTNDAFTAKSVNDPPSKYTVHSDDGGLGYTEINMYTFRVVCVSE
ncbi:hypothetical protein RCS94_10540 [Orbaceae bacterium ac157xtp]